MITGTLVTGMRVDAIPTIDIITQTITDALRDHTCLLVTFANPGTAVLVRRQNMAALYDKFDIVAPDGIAMAKAIQLLHRLPAVRISFDSTSLAPIVFAIAAQTGSRVALCGGRPGVAEQARRQLVAAYAKLNIIGTLHGYTPQPTMIATLCEWAPDIVICGMGGIVQERFLLMLKTHGWSGVGFTCGGYLDQLSQGVQYYPTVINALNLRWAYRLAKEPGRLWRRYLVDYPTFAMSLCKAIIRAEDK
jgi:N-acetylglucosaminyldiphosphoundecaprenol N-acetyl-beta-D-mannosaminyltransferase